MNGQCSPQEESTVKPNRLSKCEVCNDNDAKYTCPKCEVRTCCLKCVNVHKIELDCNGVRDRTKYIPLNKFTNTDFYNDYAFLEECSRFVYGKKRNVVKKYTNIEKPLPHYLNKLKRVARNRGTVMMIVPEHFARRRTNSSRVTRTGEIMWKVDFVFNNKLYSQERSLIQETTRLSKILHDKLSETDSTELDCFRSAGVSNIRMLLKAEYMKGCSKKFYELDPELSLKENLRGKCIIEYPTVYTFLKDHTYGLEIVQSDDEIDNETEDNSFEMKLEKDDENVGRQSNSSTIPTDNYDNQSLDNHTANNNTNGLSNRKRSYKRELATVRIAREEREKVKKEAEEEVKRKPKNLLFVTGYSSDEDVQCSDDQND